MHIFNAIGDLKRELRAARAEGKSIGLVPTMGALHEGHLSLVRIAKTQADLVVASVFVNPKQFGPSEDLEAYPRDLKSDADKLTNAGCDLIFAPSGAQMFPPDFETQVTLSKTTQGLCGAHRPGHFDGVTTVVLKLFGIVRPNVAVFGQKDFQQLAVIRRMVEDLSLDLEIVGAPLIREKDGLARSSRNVYLSPEDRARALGLSKGLFAAEAQFQGGERNAAALLASVREAIAVQNLSPEYLELRSANTLKPLDTVDQDAVLLVAAKIGNTRLIDNITLKRT